MSDDRPSSQQAIAATCRAYETHCRDYAAATSGYDAYPGLKDEVVAFEKEVQETLPVLDLGCGGGRDSRLLAGLHRQVVAGDICSGMLTTARELSADQPDAIGFVRLNTIRLPFRDGVFGGTWACGSLLHLPSSAIPQALAEVRRTLRPGGVTVISMRSGQGEGWREGGTLEGRRWFTFVDSDHFSATMTAAGFCDVRVDFSGRENWFVATGYRRSDF
ncbi:class I SAM-dependent methyltransferase [Actinoallomurus sp. NPDC052274]|uniref:class I SAM-dependent methyltransferase n=1 Tax=Actinoallomurus sp. NPDC052274 TaxID=3155420 RepID=UPI00342794E1